MRRGFFRLGVVATGVWLGLVVAVVFLQYFSANPFCQFDSSTVWKPECQSFFWSWAPVGKLAKLSPHVVHMVLVAALPVAVGWVLGLAAGWVVRGFRTSAT